MSIEESFIINLLFSESTDKNINILNIDIEKLIKISSSHLIIPSLYKEIKFKNIENSVPKDLLKYFEFIYNENLKRNCNILNEIKQINFLLEKENIKPIFLKGAALSILDIHKDIGARMIGDIDLLVSEKQYENTYNILLKNGFKSKANRFFEKKAIHKPRLTSKRNLFAVEIHNKLLIDKNFLIKPNKVIDKAQNINGILTPNYNDLILHNIYSYEINDRANLFMNYSYKNYYDTYRILKNKSVNIKVNNRYFNDYFMKAKYLKLGLNNISFKESMYTKTRFKLKKRYKLYYYLENKIVWLFLKILQKPEQFKEFFKDKNYRKHVLNKIIKPQ